MDRSPTVNISEQPRRLLLPQEIKELGRDRMILFYEGLRPVLAHRIRYYSDRWFKRRELAPPEVPKLTVVSRRPATLSDPNDDDDEHSVRPTRPLTGGARPVQPSDVAALDSLKLEDFSLNFDDIESPTGRRLTDAEVQEAVDRFLDRIVD